MMPKSFVDGLVVSSAAVVLSGFSFLFMPKNSNLALTGAILGGVGVAIALKQNQELKARSYYLTQENKTIRNLLNLEQIEQLQKQNVLKDDDFLNMPKSSENQHDKEVLTSVIEDVELAIAQLQTRGITVYKYHQPKSQDAIFDKLALHLGKHYANFKELYRRLKRSAGGEPFQLNLQNRTQEEISNFTNFCSILYQNSFLSYYHYCRADKFIKGNVQNRGDVKNFFTGLWFERFIYQVVSQIITSKGLSYTCLINSQIQFSNGNRFELDLFFLIDEKPLWIECKTGQDYNEHLRKYSAHRNTLAVSKERTFLVILDIPESQTTTLTNLWDITVVNQDNFAQSIAAVL